MGNEVSFDWGFPNTEASGLVGAPGFRKLSLLGLSQDPLLVLQQQHHHFHVGKNLWKYGTTSPALPGCHFLIFHTDWLLTLDPGFYRMDNSLLKLFIFWNCLSAEMAFCLPEMAWVLKVVMFPLNPLSQVILASGALQREWTILQPPHVILPTNLWRIKSC